MSLEDHSSFKPYVGTYIVLTWKITNARCCLFVGWLYPQPQYVVLKSTEHDLYPVIFRWYPHSHFVLVISFPSDWCNSWFRKVYLQSYIRWLATFWSEQDAAVSLFLLYLISPCCICLIPIHTLISSWPQSPGETLRGRPRAAQGGAERFRGKHLGLQRAGDSVGERWIQWISLKYFKGIYVATQNGIYGDFNINIYVTNVTSYDPI